ncbi:MAG: hypothetical protein OHK0046_49270 [Anaerolineae bacterium]
MTIGQRLWITHWPIWVKLVVAFVFALVLPFLLLGALFQSELRQIDQRNLQQYLTDEGRERVDSIEAVFEHASNELRVFADSTARLNVIRLATGLSLTPEQLINLQFYMETEIDPGIFSSVRIVSPEGDVRLVIGEEDARVGDNQANSNALRMAQTASRMGAEQRLAVYRQRGALVSEVIQVMYRDNALDSAAESGDLSNTYAYIIGRIDFEQAIYGLLSSEEFLTLYSYLVTPAGSTIAQPATSVPFNTSLRDSPLNDLLSTQNERNGTGTYTAGGTELIGYYAPIRIEAFQTPFFIVTEAPVQTSITLSGTRLVNSAALTVISLSVFGAVIALLTNQLITPALRSLSADIQALGVDDLDRPVRAAERGDDIGMVAQTFVNAREQVRNLIDELEARLISLDRDVQATREVSRYAATERNLQQLMDQVVDRIVDLFPNIYHAQIFLLDREREFAMLRASTGEAGRQLLDRGHRLQVGGVSVIGQCTEDGRVVVARDTVGSPIHRRNEFLPETRAELAIPLRIGEGVIGALDVQSKLSNSFAEDQITILQTMADQIAIAIENARLYQESVQRLEEITENNRRATFAAWREYMAYRRERSLVAEAGIPRQALPHPARRTSGHTGELRQLAITRNEAAIGERTSRDTIPFAVPIQLRGQVLGAVEWEIPVTEFNRNKVELAQELVNRLAVSLENARLFQENQRTLDRERLVNEIATQLTRQSGVDEILQTAVREVGRALRVPLVSIQLQPGAGEDTPDDAE